MRYRAHFPWEKKSSGLQAFFFVNTVNYKCNGKLQSHHVSSDKIQSQKKKQAYEMCNESQVQLSKQNVKQRQIEKN